VSDYFDHAVGVIETFRNDFFLSVYFKRRNQNANLNNVLKNLARSLVGSSTDS